MKKQVPFFKHINFDIKQKHFQVTQFVNCLLNHAIIALKN